MEQGTIASWHKKEGDSFGPGDVLCEVETDKATVSFDAQDEGVVAKILVQAGSGEVKVRVWSETLPRRL
jgi:pyruvate dehydrogenase E2 component (dihydrolipoamide acetyltransferase)